MEKEKRNSDKCSCSCDCSEELGKKVLIEYLFLDLNTCDRCIGTDKVLGSMSIPWTQKVELFLSA